MAEILHNGGLRLGKWFYLYEFLVSDKHPELVENVILEEWQILKFHYLVQFILDPLREEFGSIKINSGYRPPLLNRLVGGSETSQHVLCEACDPVLLSGNASKAWSFIMEDIKWPGQAIWYKPEPRFHIALPRIGIRSDYYICKDGRYIKQ